MGTLTVGRIVHYVSHGTPVQPDGSQAFESCCRAAIVTAVGTDGAASLCILNPTGMFFNEDVPHAEDKMVPIGHYEEYHRPGTWHWPEREA